MATKIKLEVNHGKHAKQESGQKLVLGEDKKKEENKQKSNEKVQNNKKQEKNQLNGNGKGKKENVKKQNDNPKVKKDEKTNHNKSPKKQEKLVDQKKRIDKQLETIERIKSTEKKTKLTIEQLLSQYENAADDIFTNHGHNKQKEKKVQKFLQKLEKQKKERHKKLEKLQQKELNRSQIKEKKKEQKEQRRLQRRKQRKRKQAERKLQELHSLSEQRLKRQEQYKNYYNNQYKNKDFLFQRFQKQYQKKEEAFENEVKEKLQKNKERYKPMDPLEIGDFCDNYQDNRWSLIEQNEQKRQQYNQMLEQKNKQLQGKLWKGQCHKRVSQQLKNKERVKNAPLTKLMKTRQYGTIVSSQFKPKVNESKRTNSLNISLVIAKNDDETEIIQGKQYKKVLREKYFKGNNSGLVVENLRRQLTHDEKVRKGNQYLQFLRSLPKAPKKEGESQEKVEENPQYQRRKLPQTTFKPKIVKDPYYENCATNRLGSKSATINQKRLKDPELFQYVIADFKGKSRQMQLEQRAIKHAKYDGILQLQDRHNNLNRKLIQGISQKLSLLNKM